MWLKTIAMAHSGRLCIPVYSVLVKLGALNIYKLAPSEMAVDCVILGFFIKNGWSTRN